MVDQARFTIGRTLSDSFRFVRCYPIQCLLLAALMYPITMVTPAVQDIDWPWTIYRSFVWFGPVLFTGMSLVIAFVAEAAVANHVTSHLRGRKPIPGAWVRWIHFLYPVSVGSLAIGLLPLLGAAVAFYFIFTGPHIAGLGIAIGFVSLVLYSVLTMFWAVYTPIVVLEGTSIYASLARSARLCRGRRWRVLGVYLFLYVLRIAVLIALNYAAVAVVGPGLIHGNLYVEAALISGPLNIVYVLSAVVTATLYHYLRLEDEGMDSARAVTAFD